jgi:hypothetical protein
MRKWKTSSPLSVVTKGFLQTPELKFEKMKSRKDKRPDHTQDDRKRNDALNKAHNNPQEKKLPGEYPAREDIMNRLNTQRVGMDVENFSRTIGQENLNINEPVITTPNSIEEDPVVTSNEMQDRDYTSASMERPVPRDSGSDESDLQERSESDVTDDDLEALGPKDLSMDMGEDEQLLKNRVWPVDMAGSDLDVPGAELDDENEAIGSEDEENNPYSLGGDAHEDNMEGK